MTEKFKTVRRQTDDYQRIFLEDIPLMDVRAPVEFSQGAFPNSVNIPLLDDPQREAIGTRYKQQSQDAAIALGLELATSEVREQRLQHWAEFIRLHPQGHLYCFRGGLRSRVTQTWLKEYGIDYPLITGGYKAMRRYLLQNLERCSQQIPFVILCGLTGSGKTRVLTKIGHHIDLEGLANHRGSAFGADINNFQPTQINWDNQLATNLLKHQNRHPDAGLLLEDEGKLVGRIVLPKMLHEKMRESPRIFLECNEETRINIIREDYIESSWPLYQQQYGNQATEQFSAFVLGNLIRIKKRLGGVRYTAIKASFERALMPLFERGDSHLFDEGIRLLLVEYYDPMYRYQLQKKPVKITFRGTEPEILEWAGEQLAHLKSNTSQ
jgi:tRNA 2-selenouridine synthase